MRFTVFSIVCCVFASGMVFRMGWRFSEWLDKMVAMATKTRQGKLFILLCATAFFFVLLRAP